MPTETTERNEKLRALWVLVQRAGGELHISAEEVAAIPATMGVTSVPQPDGSITLWRDAGDNDDT